MKRNLSTLAHKKILIIGGSAGIGLATAKLAAEKGAIVIIASSSRDRIDKALQSLPDNAQGITADMNDEPQIKSLFQRVGHFDHLIYTAGDIFQSDLLFKTDIERTKQQFNVRYWGALSAIKYAIPYIREAGSIVLTSGIASERPAKGWSIGASISAAMEGFTRAMALELAPVRVNVVSPGIVKTDLWSLIPEEQRQALFAQAAGLLPVAKVAAAEDIALAYVFLMEQSYMTGQVVTVDGGGVLINIYARL